VINLRVGVSSDTSVVKKGKKKEAQVVGRERLIMRRRAALTVE